MPAPQIDPALTNRLSPYWQEKFAAARTTEDLMTHSMSYLRAALAQGFPDTIEARESKRLKVAVLLLEIALEP